MNFGKTVQSRYGGLNLIVIFSVPSKVNLPTLTAFTSSSVSLEWDSVRGGSLTYIISWRSAHSNSSASGTTSTTRYKANHLESDTAYIFTVAARNQAGSGLPSEPVTFETSMLACKIINRFKNMVN